MESIDELQHSYDHTTSTRSQSRQVPIENQDEEIVVLVRECKKIIVVHHPSDKIISIGRSKNNNIRIPNPHFPRQAAEIVLGPVPLLRKPGKSGTKTPDIIPIETGKPIRMGPYNIYLLKPGDIYFNHINRNSPLKKFRHLIILLVLASLLLFFLLHNFRIVPGVKAQRVEPGDNTSEHESSGNQRYINDDEKRSAPLHESSTSPTANTHNFNEMNYKESDSRGKGDKTGIVEKIPSPGTKGIAPGKLETLVNTAMKSIDLGNPEQAGRIILPVHPYLSLDQKSQLVQSLEPGLRSLYQKAYMLREYDRPASRAVLDQIVKSGLRILPTFQKAEELLESEKKVKTAGRTTKTLVE